MIERIFPCMHRLEFHGHICEMFDDKIYNSNAKDVCHVVKNQPQIIMFTESIIKRIFSRNIINYFDEFKTFFIYNSSLYKGKVRNGRLELIYPVERISASREQSLTLYASYIGNNNCEFKEMCMYSIMLRKWIVLRTDSKLETLAMKCLIDNKMFF